MVSVNFLRLVLFIFSPVCPFGRRKLVVFSVARTFRHSVRLVSLGPKGYRWVLAKMESIPWSGYNS